MRVNLEDKTSFKNSLNALVKVTERKGSSAVSDLVSENVKKAVEKRGLPKIDEFNRSIDAQNPIDESKTGDAYVLELLKNSGKKISLVIKRVKAGEPMLLPSLYVGSEPVKNKNVTFHAFVVENLNTRGVFHTDIRVKKLFGFYKIEDTDSHKKVLTRSKDKFVNALTGMISEHLKF